MPIDISGISKRYGRDWALRDVDVNVTDGEIVGVLGPAGAGKSTLLRIIAGLEQATGSLSAADRLGELHFARPRQRSWFDRIWERPDPSEKEKQQAFEQAIRGSSAVLVFDDLFAGIDPALLRENIARLRAHADEKGVAVIYAANDFETLAFLCDRLLVLIGGCVRQTGTPEDVYEAPCSVAVAMLTGRCNLFEARRLTSSQAQLPEFQIITSGTRIFAERADVAKLGPINRNVWLAIRPENISISFGASFPEDNLIRAVVTGFRFTGPTTVISFEASGLTLEALVPRLVGLKIGDECMLGLPPDRVRILKE